MEELKLREVKSLAHGPTAGKVAEQEFKVCLTYNMSPLKDSVNKSFNSVRKEERKWACGFCGLALTSWQWWSSDRKSGCVLWPHNPLFLPQGDEVVIKCSLLHLPTLETLNLRKNSDQNLHTGNL